ncbi:hypothetical protein PF003_g11048 [Phytophthora fragariae]|nr:hypothetical protein PF003_g11048 [Phytophthora fragariae]
MPRKRIPTRYTNRFKARAVEDWRESKARGVSRVEFAKPEDSPPSMSAELGAQVLSSRQGVSAPASRERLPASCGIACLPSDS